MSQTKEPQRHSQPPPITLEPEWKDVRLPFNVGSGRTLFTGLEGANRMRLRLFKRDNDQHLIGRVWCGPGSEGPPHCVHGGALAYILDEAMGSTGWSNNYPVLAVQLGITYLHRTPLEVDLEIEARILKTTANRVFLAAEIRVPGRGVCVTSEGEFAILTREQAKIFQEISDPTGLLTSGKLKWAAD